jgi:hypothetical protein
MNVSDIETAQDLVLFLGQPGELLVFEEYAGGHPSNEERRERSVL